VKWASINNLYLTPTRINSNVKQKEFSSSIYQTGAKKSQEQYAVITKQQ
jgi:hypothetical protein